MGVLEKLRKNLDKEHEEFIHGYDTMEKIQIYNDWYIIGIYEQYYELLKCYYFEDNIDIEIIEWLSNIQNPLRFIYDQFISADICFSENWNNMIKFLETIYEEEQEV